MVQVYVGKQSLANDAAKLFGTIHIGEAVEYTDCTFTPSPPNKLCTVKNP